MAGANAPAVFFGARPSAANQERQSSALRHWGNALERWPHGRISFPFGHLPSHGALGLGSQPFPPLRTGYHNLNRVQATSMSPEFQHPCKVLGDRPSA